jgi:hypothetical protein
MKFAWLIALRPEDAGALSSLRLTAGVEVAVGSDALWLRGPACEGPTAAALAALPATGRFERLNADQLRRIDRRIPIQMPALHGWRSLSRWLEVRWPMSAPPAQPPLPTQLRFVRSAEEQEPGLLLTTLEEWAAYATHAPKIRLDPLRFAGNVDGKIVVCGVPLPPISGQRFVLHGRVAVPAGWIWFPAVDRQVLERKFGSTDGAIALWQDAESVTMLPAESFVPATRSAVALTLEAAKGSYS